MDYKTIIEEMTLEEKAAIMSGKGFWNTLDIERLGIPSITLADGPHGIRKQAGETDHLGLNPSIPATCFPTASAMANSWNDMLGEAIGCYLGREAKSQEVDVILGPGLNIKRSPLCGRNFEYFSEDPYLSGKMAAGYVRGIQSEGVAACPKHFAVNSQELRRMSNDSVLDERTFREIYATAFEIAVKEGNAKTIMTSYNKINGIYANENEHLLSEILVDEWGFDGFVVTDWGASNDHAKGVAAGSHLEMPTTGKDGQRLLIKAIEKGELTEKLLDERVNELLKVVFELNKSRQEHENFNIEEHHAKAKQSAEECIVLLKNEDKILPLKTTNKVGIIGDFARVARYQGAGSSQVNPTKLDNPIDIFSKGDNNFVGFQPGYNRNGKEDRQLAIDAVMLAKQVDTVVLYLGLDEAGEAEGMDRTHMRLAKNQIELLEEIAKVNENIVVILSAGCAIEMPWINNVKGLLHGYLLGQAGAEAMVDTLYGMNCPSGRLAETYPLKLEETPCFNYYPGEEKTAEYREAIFVGYRYYQTVNKPVLFPFGYGLSYTEFSYDSLEIKEKEAIVKITNTGDVAGAEVVQMYVSLPGSQMFRPIRELKGFEKVYLQPKESVCVSIPFDDKTFRYYNVKTKDWEVERGIYIIQVGRNVNEIVLEEEIEKVGTDAENPYIYEKLKPYYKGDVTVITDEYFEHLLGGKIPESKWDTKKALELNDAVSQMYYAKSGLARLFLRILARAKRKSIEKGKPNLNINFIYDIPFRGMAKMMGGAVSMEMAEAIVEIVNGHFLRGMKNLIGGALRNRK